MFASNTLKYINNQIFLQPLHKLHRENSSISNNVYGQQSHCCVIRKALFVGAGDDRAQCRNSMNDSKKITVCSVYPNDLQSPTSPFNKRHLTYCKVGQDACSVRFWNITALCVSSAKTDLKRFWRFLHSYNLFSSWLFSGYLYLKITLIVYLVPFFLKC